MSALQTALAHDHVIALVYRSATAHIYLHASGRLEGTHKEIASGFSYSNNTRDVDVRIGIDSILLRMEEALFVEKHADLYRRSEARRELRSRIGDAR